MKVGDGGAPVLCLAPQATGKPRLAPPIGAWDTHAHVIGPAPWAEARNYDPPLTTTQAYVDMLDAVGFDYGVLVQVSVHGLNNAPMIEALEAYKNRLRGIVAVRADTPLDELKRLDAAGVRGVRILTIAKGGVGADEAAELARRIAPLGWHTEFGVLGEHLPQLRPLIDSLPTPVSIAHFGGTGVTVGTAPEIRDALLGILEKPERYVKVSAPYRLSARPWSDMTTLARELAARAPDQLLWGSDWPFVGLMDEGDMPSAEDLFDAFCGWFPDEALRRRILVENPARLYGLPG